MAPSSYPRRGEVYWTALDPSVGSEMQKTRPCLVISSNRANRERRTVVVIPLSTTSPKAFPFYVAVPSASKDSLAVIDQLRAVDRTRIGGWYCTLTSSEMSLIVDAMRLVFELQ